MEGVEGADGMRTGQCPQNLQGGMEEESGQVASAAHPGSKMSWVHLCLGLSTTVDTQTRPTLGLPGRATAPWPSTAGAERQAQVPPKLLAHQERMALLLLFCSPPFSSSQNLPATLQTLVPNNNQVTSLPEFTTPGAKITSVKKGK